MGARRILVPERAANPVRRDTQAKREALRLDLNPYLYLLLFLIVLGLYLFSLVKSGVESRRSREDTTLPGRRYTDPEEEPADKGE